jgi:dihydropteroate synthase
VVREVRAFLVRRAEACVQAGMRREQILLDPGFGFGKSLEHNLQLLSRLTQLTVPGFHLLVGLSRKSLIAKLTGRDVGRACRVDARPCRRAAWRSGLRAMCGRTADALRILAALAAVDEARA